eukprot:scaffold1384_cov116-Cylindrotheca_fusiformis.AAC.25
MVNASGLAASIRGSVESSTFDLAGQNVDTIKSNITSAFQEPLTVSEMIRLTFVTGAGKLGRQKYDADAAKAVTSALRDLGFEEDRGASCVKECAGFFKLQHDTGKNLKTVVVFPRIVEAGGSGEAQAEGSGSNGDNSSPFYPKGGVEDMMISSSTSVFENMIKSKCPSWSEKKGCLASLAAIKTQQGELEQKLMSGTPLTDGEQEFYDSVSAESLDQKHNLVKDLMHEQVGKGEITAQEKAQLLSQVNERLETVSKELEQANAKKAEKMNGVKQKLEQRKKKLSSISPQEPHKLKHEAAIFQLRAELQPLLELEDGTSGRLLSLKESKSLARKEEILEEIAEFERKSRGWFEDDESFSQRLEMCNRAWSATKKQTSKGGKKTSASTSSLSSSRNPWVTNKPTTSKLGSKTLGSGPKKSKGSNGNGGVFSAMMLDSDSDSD